MSHFYDWSKTLSYDAPITMVVGARGIGKTYGLRVQVVKDWIKSKRTFVEVCRRVNEMSLVETGYFDKIQEQFPGYIFQVEKDRAYIATKPKDEDDKPVWKLLGYYVAMSQFQLLKKRTFSGVKRILMDEAVIDNRDRYHRYLRDEWGVLQNIVDTVTREHAGDGTQPRLYLLGNSCDILNPFFMQAKINGMPPRGYSWHMGKMFLLDYPDASEYAEEKRHTLAGMMAEGDNEASSLENKFADSSLLMIAARPKNAIREFTLIFDGNPISAWTDYIGDTLWITATKPKKDPVNVYVVGMHDDPSYPILRTIKPICDSMYALYGQRNMYFTTPQAHGIWQNLMEFMGYR